MCRNTTGASVFYFVDNCQSTNIALRNHTSTARERHKHGSRAVQAILMGVAGNTRGLCLPNPRTLQVKPDSIVCKTRRDCLSDSAALLVGPANYRCYAAKVGGYKHQVALEWVKDGYADDTEGDGRTRMNMDEKEKLGSRFQCRKSVLIIRWIG